MRLDIYLENKDFNKNLKTNGKVYFNYTIEIFKCGK